MREDFINASSTASAPPSHIEESRGRLSRDNAYHFAPIYYIYGKGARKERGVKNDRKKHRKSKKTQGLFCKIKQNGKKRKKVAKN